MGINQIKITREEINKLNEAGNIYATKADIQSGNSVDINSMYFGDNGELYLDDQGRIIEKQENGTEVYMGWTDINKPSKETEKTNATTSTKTASELQEPWNNKPLTQGKDDKITVTPISEDNKTSGNSYQKEELKSTPTSDSNQPRINSAWDYNEQFKNGEAPVNTTNSFQKTEAKDTSFKTITFSDGKPAIIIENPQNSNNELKPAVASNQPKVNSAWDYNEQFKNGEAPTINNTNNKVREEYGDTIADIDNIEPYKEINSNNYSKIYDTTAANAMKNNNNGNRYSASEGEEETETTVATSNENTNDKEIRIEEEKETQETPDANNYTTETGNEGNAGIKPIENITESEQTPVQPEVQPEVQTDTTTAPQTTATAANASIADGLDAAMRTAFAEGAYASEDAARSIADVIINRALKNGTSIGTEIAKPHQFSAYESGMRGNGNWGWNNYGSGPSSGSIGTERVQQIFMEELNKAISGQPLTYGYTGFRASGDNVTNVYH